MDKETKPRCICVTQRTIFTIQIFVDIAIWCIICLPVLVFFICGTPFPQGFFCDDKSLMYPYHTDTVTTPMLMIAGLGLPIIMILITEVIRAADRGEKHAIDFLTALKGISFFLFGTMVNKVFTEVVKYTIGRPRPHFFDVCKPDFSSINCSAGFITEYACTNTELSSLVIRDSRLSFPSGHASFGSFCAVYTVLYLQHRFVLKSSVLLKPTLQASLVLLNVWCCATRITDNKHFSTDVIAGFLSGTTVAWLVFYKVALLTLKTVKFAEFPRSYSVNSTSEPRTPDPLLKDCNHDFNLYLDDAIKPVRPRSTV